MVGAQHLVDLNPKRNSIGFIRLAAALLVIVGHSFPYGGFGDDPLAAVTNNQVGVGRFPVDVFFALSGFLIAQSFARSPRWTVFLWHRFLRIYPAFWVCLMITGLLVAPILGNGIDLWYEVRNAPIVTGVINEIPGLFMTSPETPTVNSSLWTLPWELRAYLVLFVIGVTGLLRNRWGVLALFGAAWAIFTAQILGTTDAVDSSAITDGARLFTFFFAGMVFFVFRDKIPIRGDFFAVACALLVAAIFIGDRYVPHAGGLFYIVAPLPLTYAVFWLSMRLPFHNVNARWDFSYGIYIYGTLTLNILFTLGLNGSWLSYITLATCISVSAAAISWYAIEKPSLKLKNVRLRSQRQLVVHPALAHRR